jgi:hypothetical protein
MLEFCGMAVNIDPSNLILALGEGDTRAFPEMGSRVRLELLLPVNSENAKAKCLTVRARVVRVTEMPDGSRQIGLSFRKASFKDREDSGFESVAKAHTNGWEM